MSLGYDKDMIVESAYATSNGDPAIVDWPHTVVIGGLHIARREYEDGQSGDTQYQDALDTFRKNIGKTLEELHGRVYHTVFDFEKKKRFKPCHLSR